MHADRPRAAIRCRARQAELLPGRRLPPESARRAVHRRRRGPGAGLAVPGTTIYAIRIRNGSELWRFATADRPGVNFPDTASAHVETIDGQDVVFLANGQTMYALDAATGAERWHFDAGTGCVVPGACDFDLEGNEIESSVIYADGKVFFGMDHNDRVGGKGGFYALDARDGRLVWFLDIESGVACRPDAGDDIRRYDGYHCEAELGLPPGFLASRAGCDHPRSPNGCGNIWSSPAYDSARQLLYVATSNCDTDANPLTLEPDPPMPPYEEALLAIGADGSIAWKWRPREVDNDDLAFGAVPNLFTAEIGGARREVVGVGNKDGTFYLLDRDGVNELNAVRWDNPDPSQLPYWRRKVVPGGAAGGILATAAVDEEAGRIYFTTAPGSFSDVFNPQRPTVHALDAGSGAVLWQNTGEANADASFAPTSAVPGLVFAGSVLGGLVRAYDATSGSRVARHVVGFSLAAAPVVIDGLAMVGAGTGFRSGDPADDGEISSRIPQNVTAFCVPGTRACATDVPVVGERLSASDGQAASTRRSFSVRATDPAIVTPALGSADDPTVAGAG